MFGFGRKKQPTPPATPTTPPLPGPAQLPGNPGRAASGTVRFTNETLGEWAEEFDAATILADAMTMRGHDVRRHKTWVEHVASGYRFLPLVADFVPRDDSRGVQSTTTIQLDHPTLAPGGLFEYQHSWGDSMPESIFSGFDQWAQTDLVTLLDAPREEPAGCTAFMMEFPDKPGRIRRALLGPVAHMALSPPPAPAEGSEEAEHPFCACCLLTRSLEAFKGLLEQDDFLGLRLFAARGADGTPQADCRVNGEDFETGAIALREYVQTWPGEGYEFRKQYVVLQTIDKPANGG